MINRMKSENPGKVVNQQKGSKTYTIILFVFIALLVVGKFLWATTIWYEIIPVSIALILWPILKHFEPNNCTDEVIENNPKNE